MRIKKNKLIACTLALCCLASVCGCSKGDDSSSSSNTATSSDQYKAVSEGIEGLRKLGESSTYVISNVYSTPAGDECYIEVNNSDGCYTEYPVDDEGNWGSIPLEQASDTTYMLYDWLTNDGKDYMVNTQYSEEDSSSAYWILMPDDYSKSLSSRKVLFLDDMIDDVTSWSTEESQDYDFGDGNGAVPMDVYTGTLPSNVVAEICGIDTLGLYKTIKAQATESKDENMLGLMDRYIDELTTSLTFSDGKLTIGIYDGAVRYMQLEAGGLGTRMYYTKSVLTQSVEERDLPDFSSSGNYYDTVKDLADYVAKYDSYEEAMEALNSSSSSADDSSASESVDDTETKSDSTDPETDTSTESVTDTSVDGAE